MVSFTNTLHINRPLDQVYTYLSDPQHTPEWNWAITETKKISPGPVSVGTRYSQTRSVPRNEVETLEITSLETNRNIEIRGTLTGLPARVQYQFAETESGTELMNSIDLELSGALRVISPIVGNRIKAAVADNLRQLKTLLELTRVDQTSESLA